MARKILLVEDDSGTRLLLQRMLEKMDPAAEIKAVESAESAFAVLNEAVWELFPYEVAIVDLNLPGSNGLLLWQVSEKRFPTEFLFISAMAKEDWDAKTAGYLPALQFLQKPVSEAGLAAFLRNRGKKAAA